MSYLAQIVQDARPRRAAAPLAAVGGAQSTEGPLVDARLLPSPVPEERARLRDGSERQSPATGPAATWPVVRAGEESAVDDGISTQDGDRSRRPSVAGRDPLDAAKPTPLHQARPKAPRNPGGSRPTETGATSPAVTSREAGPAANTSAKARTETVAQVSAQPGRVPDREAALSDMTGRAVEAGAFRQDADPPFRDLSRSAESLGAPERADTAPAPVREALDRPSPHNAIDSPRGSGREPVTEVRIGHLQIEVAEAPVPPRPAPQTPSRPRASPSRFHVRRL